MEVPLQDSERKLYNKLYISCSDISFARYCADMLLKKGLHVMPWERRGTIYLQQIAFTTALITSYSRAFTTSKGLPSIPSKLVNYDEDEQRLHNQILESRNKIYAHSDGDSYSVRPWRSEGFKTDLVRGPVFMLSPASISLFLLMSGKVVDSLRKRMEEILNPAGS